MALLPPPPPVQRLVTHKDYVVEMVTSIIKETDLDLCGEHSSKDLGASSLFDLSRVCPCPLSCTSPFFFYSRFNCHVLIQALMRMKTL